MKVVASILRRGYLVDERAHLIYSNPSQGSSAEHEQNLEKTVSLRRDIPFQCST
jgi:hypothetical protein